MIRISAKLMRLSLLFENIFYIVEYYKLTLQIYSGIIKRVRGNQAQESLRLWAISPR